MVDVNGIDFVAITRLPIYIKPANFSDDFGTGNECKWSGLECGLSPAMSKSGTEQWPRQATIGGMPELHPISTDLTMLCGGHGPSMP